METIPVRPSQQVERSEAQLKPIDAIYTLDDYLEPCGVRPVASVQEPLPFDPDVSYRVYFEHTDPPDEIDSDDLPHVDIFILLKCECLGCGYTVRITQKWIDDVGLPVCPNATHPPATLARTQPLREEIGE